MIFYLNVQTKLKDNYFLSQHLKYAYSEHTKVFVAGQGRFMLLLRTEREEDVARGRDHPGSD